MKRRNHNPPAPRSSPYARRPAARNTTFVLSDMYQGQTFFDGFEFWDEDDPTHGDVTFVDRDTAQSQGLIWTTDTQAFMRVDNTTVLQTGQSLPRQSVRIGTNKTYDGALFVLDIDTMPFGCATWPAFWTVSQTEAWPLGGEIDIIEGVNNNPLNQMTLHTGPGCEPNTPASDYSGNLMGTTCDSTPDDNSGCGFQDPSNSSYGQGLNSAGGGVFAMHWDGGGVRIWHFTHGDDLPCDLAEQSPNPDPDNWPTPQAAWVADGCSPYTYLKDHQAIIETTLCGDWAGAAFDSPNSGCSGACSDWVANPANFDDAVWTINYMAVYLEQ